MTVVGESVSDNELLASIPLPEGWLWTTVSTLGEFDGDAVKTGPFGAILKSKEFVSSGVPILAVGNVQSGHLDLKNVRVDHITEKKAAELSDYRLRAGDVLFTRSGTIGRSAVVPPSSEGWMMSYHLLRVRPDQQLINPQYLYFVFAGCQASQQHTQDSTIGTTRPGINTQILKDVPVPLPPRAEQERLVATIDELFSRVNSARDHLSKIPTILKRFRQAVLGAACSGGLTEDWRSSNSDALVPVAVSARPPSLPDSDLPDLPEGWVWTTIGSVAASEKNSITDGPFGSNLKTEHYTANGPRVIRLQNIGDYRFVDLKAHISREHFDSLAKHQIQAGDVAIACLGDPVPRACEIPSSVGPAIVKADCVRFKPNPSLAHNSYLCYVLNDSSTRLRMSEIVHGVGRARLNVQQIKSIPVPLPPMAEQVEVVRRVESMLRLSDEIANRVTVASEHNKALKQSILAKAFRGELVPTEAERSRREGRDYEPASVLLERIRAKKANQAKSPPVPKRKLRRASAHV